MPIVRALPVVVALMATSLLPAVVSAASVTVTIGDSLSPREVRVAPGTSVVWVNRDDDRHRVRSVSGPDEFDSGNLEPGESFSATLRGQGTYVYVDDRDRDDPAYHGRVIVGSSAGESGAPPPATPPVAATVSMAGRSYGPSTVTIAPGGTVTFRNDDDREHTATGRGGSFDSGILAPGREFRRTFTNAGSFAFLCALHPDMTGTVVVQAADGSTPATPREASPTPRPIPAPTTAPSATVDGPVNVERDIVDFAFTPDTTTIVAGSTIHWTNRGIAPHTVTARDGSFDSGVLASGGDFGRTFSTEGSFRFLCAIHPGMTGTVIVSAAQRGEVPEATPGQTTAPGESPRTTPSAAARDVVRSAGTSTASAAPAGAGRPPDDARPAGRADAPALLGTSVAAG